ncbi:MAG: alginate O-acetyltransferase complex protein AlgI [Halieaceae bacterium]|jgi:alginate O-acetyltransferase complex protein AlgI
MLFSSTYFIFLFLPLVLIGFHALRLLAGARAGRLLLIVASTFFYGWWNPAYVVLIVLSMVSNYTIGSLIGRAATDIRYKRLALLAGLASNLGLLAYYKYAGFIVVSVSGLLVDYPILIDIVLPLAISFFTFQQVAFLVDVYRDNSIMETTTLEKYLCFILFFPQLIAGPIVHHKQLVPQLADKVLNGITSRHIMLGIGIFLLGLFKKVVLADQIADISEPIFLRHGEGSDLDPVTAWIGILAFTFRLYFDFSGYSDMAFGLGLMFGIILPINFFSPYKATNINETWLRWNITLGQFFAAYVFKPLGGRSRNVLTTARNVLILMLLSGVWHGAGWNYLIWGLMQGSAMVWLLFWPGFISLVTSIKLRESWAYSTLFCGAITFTFWILSLVAFKVTRVEDISRYYKSMFTLSATDIGEWIESYYQQVTTFTESLFMGGSLVNSVLLEGTSWLIVSFAIVFLAPNVFQFFGITRNGRIGRAKLSVGRGVLAGVAGGLALAMTISGTSSDFIYFVF